MIDIDHQLTAADLADAADRLFDLAGEKIARLQTRWNSAEGSPVFTVEGQYTARGWTEWTQGFQFGAALLQFDATGDARSLEIGRRSTWRYMASHVSHTGVHDHGFNNISTFGNLRRLMLEGRIDRDEGELAGCELALKVSGAVQAARWSSTHDGGGYIYSFNGPHSLFCDTMRSLRSLSLAHRLGHSLMAENDEAVSLLKRMVQHAAATARWSVYDGQGRDIYDLPGRVAHECLFNTNDGRYRCASTQQGYSPFSTWTRGLAWIMLGYPEQLEFLAELDDAELQSLGGRPEIEAMMLRAARAACDFYIEQTPTDGVPYWDTGAPGLPKLGDYLARPADPFNDFEPVDSSAAAIAAQGLLRLGRYLQTIDPAASSRYWQAGLTVLRTILAEPYLALDAEHEGLLLHTIYHRPRGWDHVPAGANTPRGESCQWGDYHLLEAALYLQRVARRQPYYTFFGPSC